MAWNERVASCSASEPHRSVARYEGRVEVVGRYVLYDVIASGGMGTVHFGKLRGPLGFSRPVAIKRLHPELACDPVMREMFLDEGRLAARIRHPNVAPVLDVVVEDGCVLLVMDYVHGGSLRDLMRAARASDEPVTPPRIAAAVVSGILHGLHAAHEATAESGDPLDVVHRDVSPHNVVVGVDGVARVIDFGIARTSRRAEGGRAAAAKGKLAYMAPEQLRGGAMDRRADVFAASVILWELLTGKRLFVRNDGGNVLLHKLLSGAIDPPSAHAPDLPKLLDVFTLQGLAAAPEHRFPTAREMALALERWGEIAPPSEVGEWVERLAGQALAERAARLGRLEALVIPTATTDPSDGAAPDTRPPAPDADAPSRDLRRAAPSLAPVVFPSSSTASRSFVGAPALAARRRARSRWAWPAAIASACAATAVAVAAVAVAAGAPRTARSRLVRPQAVAVTAARAAGSVAVAASRPGPHPESCSDSTR